MPSAKKNLIIATTPEELTKTLKQLGFVTKKEVKKMVIKEVYSITRKHYLTLTKYLKELNSILKKKFLGKSKYFVVGDPYSVERNLH